MSSRRYILAGLLLCATAGAADHQLPGRVLRVVDGDSLVLEVRGGLYQVDLADIDAPELNQPWGTEASAWLNQTLTGAFVVVEGRPVGGRILGSLTFKDRDIALDLLYDGLAWSTVPAVPRQPPHRYTEAEQQARDARRGLWSDAKPIAPWDWRTGRIRPLYD